MPIEDRAELWPTWQRTATDAWLSDHPDDAWARRPAEDHRPTIDEIVRRGQRLATAMDGVPSDWRIRPKLPERPRYEAQVGFFHEQMAGLYGPIFRAIERLRAGEDREASETLIRFLEADIYCFRSGYTTAEVIGALRRANRTESDDVRLRRIVLVAVDGHDRREFRAFCRLAMSVADDGLRRDLERRLASPEPRTARHARWVLDQLRVPGR